MVAVASGYAVEIDEPAYVGLQCCKKWHEKIYNKFIDSGHPFKIRSADLAEASGFPLPQGYSWDDIFYVIGGETKKIRCIDQTGYIVTATKEGASTPTQYNLNTGRWVDYYPGEKKRTKVGKCCG